MTRRLPFYITVFSDPTTAILYNSIFWPDDCHFIYQYFMTQRLPFSLSVFSDPTTPILYISMFWPDDCHFIYQYFLTRWLPFYISIFSEPTIAILYIKLSNVNNEYQDFRLNCEINRIRVWRYQRDKQNTSVEEGQTNQWPKEQTTIYTENDQ